MKIDVQGTELDVLAGAAETLCFVDWILLEVAFDPVYEGEPLFAEVDAALRAAGWIMRWRGLATAQRRRSVVTQLDALYERAEPEGAR